MSYPYASSSQPPPTTPYTAPYIYQQGPYAQHPGYAQAYSQNHAGYTYQYYPQPHATPYVPAKQPPPTLPLSTAAGTTQQYAAPQPTPTLAPNAPTTRAPKKPQSLKGTFSKELRSMMYAFGDAKEPASDTVDVMEEILMEYLVDVCNTALAPTRKTRIQVDDLRRALGRYADGKKLARLEELLFMQDDIRRARSVFNTEDTNVGGAVSD